MGACFVPILVQSIAHITVEFKVIQSQDPNEAYRGSK